MLNQHAFLNGEKIRKKTICRMKFAKVIACRLR